MREIGFEEIARTVEELCIKANCVLPEDMRKGLLSAAADEKSPVGREILADIAENFRCAEDCVIPICQDTGMTVVFCDVGQEAHITGGLLSDAVNEGVRRGYLAGRLRCSVVADPFRRENTEDNTPAVLHTRLVAGDSIDITVAPKGFGSENMSAMKMFLRSATQEDVENYIAATVAAAGANPCPPIVLGVGIGGTAEQCVLLSKRALMRPIDEANPDPFYAGMERRLLDGINALGIGPQGLGGSVTALAVNILTYPTHIAGLPCAVNFGCHVTRHASAKI